MARLERHRFAFAVLLAVTVNAWAQTTSQPSEQAVASAEAAALEDSAAAAMEKLSGASTVTPIPITINTPAAEAGQYVATAPPVEMPPDTTAAVPTGLPEVMPPSSTAAPSPVTDAYPDAGLGVATTSMYPSVEECKVLAGTEGKMMQVILFICCCGALGFKYKREPGSRSLREFLMDSSKQLMGAGWIHVLNLMFAKGLEAHFQAGDECTWYWLNIVLDCTLGVAVEYFLLKVLMVCVQKNAPGHAEDLETGDYKTNDGKDDPKKYIKQVLMWLLIVTLMKACMFVIMSVGHEGLSSLAKAILKPFASDATLKLFVVMIFTPVCFNILQFWMVDNFIKKQGVSSSDTSNDTESDGTMRTRIQHGDL